MNDASGGVLVSQIGARRHYAVPRALHAQGVLEHLVTDACADHPPWSWMRVFSPRKLAAYPGFRRLLGRSVPGVPVDLISSFPWFALSSRWDRRVDERDTDRWARRNARFCRRVVRRGFGQASAVYSFNGAAQEVFESARRQGLRTVLDQTAAPWRWNTKMLKEETSHWPGWESRPAEIDELGRLAEREEAEWELADCIICGSDFIVDAMSEIGGPVEKCVLVEYPTPEIDDGDAGMRAARDQEGPLRVLFVGSLQLRKGVQYLWKAKEILGDSIVLRVVGASLLSESANARLSRVTDLRGPVPRSEVAEHLAWSDVLVLPTLSEGSANVVCEAQAAGVPVLTTSAAGSSVEHERDGWLVPVRDVGSLVEILADSERVRAMCRRLADASNRRPSRSLADYGRDLVSAIEFASEGRMSGILSEQV